MDGLSNEELDSLIISDLISSSIQLRKYLPKGPCMNIRRKEIVDNACESTLKDMGHFVYLTVKNNILLWLSTQSLQSDQTLI